MNKKFMKLWLINLGLELLVALCTVGIVGIFILMVILTEAPIFVGTVFVIIGLIITSYYLTTLDIEEDKKRKPKRKTK